MINKNIDKLTRLYNEDFLREELKRELKRAERYGRPLSFLLIDPNLSEEDYLQVGFLALKKIAAITRELTRFLDIKVRIKNRILILLPETDYHGALKVAEKIYKKIDETTFRQFPNIKMNPKIGIASFPEDGVDKESIFKALEKDMEVPLKEKRREKESN